MGNVAEIALPGMDADSLKLRFKKLSMETNNVYQNWQIRVHRSLSWFKRAAAFGEDQPEARFLFFWIALNSLYSRWNIGKNAPDQDSSARDDFLTLIGRLDGPILADKLQKHRGLVKKVLSDPYLSEAYWRDPEHPKSKGWATQDANYLDHHFKEKAYSKVLIQVMRRLFVLRGQIVHGASTGGSKLNRSSLRYCLQLLEIFVPVIQYVVIEKGRGDDWPELCYPPRN